MSDPQYTSAKFRANFVEWAIPAEDEEPSPFTWASVDETNDNIVKNISSLFATHSILLTNNRFIQVPSNHLLS
jgi:hypothetical protein